MLVRCTNDVSANAEMMPLVLLTMMQCLPKNGVPEKYCKANFLGRGETNGALGLNINRLLVCIASFLQIHR